MYLGFSAAYLFLCDIGVIEPHLKKDFKNICRGRDSIQ
jgi:hypothetical protein